MNKLTKQEKVNLIIEQADKHDITAYEFGKNTNISAFAADRLLSGKTDNPSNKTLNEMLTYIENKIVGSELPDHKNFSESPANYEAPTSNKELKNSIDRLAELVSKNTRTFSKALELTLLNTEEILVHTQSIEEIIEEGFSSLSSLETTIQKIESRKS